MAEPRSATIDLVLTAAMLAGGLTRAGAALRDDRPSRTDVERMEQGYYERLIDLGRQPGEPAAPARPGAAVDPFRHGRLVRPVADLREYALKPGLATTHKGATWTTNALGMRDRPYETAKPPRTVRIAMVGDSIGAGWGVDDGRGFEP